MEMKSRALLVIRILFGLLILAAVVYLVYLQVANGSMAPFMVSFPYAGHQRLLVLAPHEDDETLGPGGLILAARRAGMEVRVVEMTNGDGTILGTMEDFHKLIPKAADYIRMGNLRQKETIQAMQVLGVPEQDVYFLSYPDRGTFALWTAHWTSQYISPYTRAGKSPYTLTYDAEAIYTGENLLKDLKQIMASYQPDLVVYPHPEDVHSDHWGLNAFTHLAIALLEKENPGYRPDTYVYLVHRPDYPMPKGLYPDDDLVPPPPLIQVDSLWYRLDLNRADERLKEKAIDQYRTQLPTLRELLDSFVRKNEIFGADSAAVLPVLSVSDETNPSDWWDANGLQVQPVQRDPTFDYPTRDLLPGSDLVALYAGDWQEQLLVCLQLRGKVDPNLTYEIRLKSIGPAGVVDRLASNRPAQAQLPVKMAGKYVCMKILAADLQQPDFLYLGGSVSGRASEELDRIAWKLVYVHPEDVP
jgi:LmbE family N-acetylglucosaminyl deacetylase